MSVEKTKRDMRALAREKKKKPSRSEIKQLIKADAERLANKQKRAANKKQKVKTLVVKLKLPRCRVVLRVYSHAKHVELIQDVASPAEYVTITVPTDGPILFAREVSGDERTKVTELQYFHLRKDIILAYSRYVNGLLWRGVRARWTQQRNQGNEAILADYTTCTAMFLLKRWLHTASVRNNENHLDGDTQGYLELALLANKWRIAGAQNEALRAVYEVTLNMNSLDADFKMIYAATEPGDSIRKFLVALFVMHVEPTEMFNTVLAQPLGYPGEFVHAVTEARSVWGKKVDGGLEFVLEDYFVFWLGPK